MYAIGAADPVFGIIGSVFKVTLFPMNGGVSEGVNILLKLILENLGKRTPFFTDHLQTSSKNIERWLKQLKSADTIVFRGPKKRWLFLYK